MLNEEFGKIFRRKGFRIECRKVESDVGKEREDGRKLASFGRERLLKK